ncbi:MAG: type II toxin-antitoxin system VapC family toxin [gamma proteobacterium symbiont of Taylorina sp.]|nr:type II toxin-antitoxin system VapC family toxin [gamma proteobacterium symbiont of Taylorina sp.]
MKLILDTNAYSALMQGREEVVSYVKQAEAILLSEVVIGELMFGFRNGSKLEKNISQLKKFLDNYFVKELVIDWNTADRYSRIATILRKKGQPIPTNDLWIAAHTIQTGAELVSYDKHFEVIDGLIWKFLKNS